MKFTFNHEGLNIEEAVGITAEEVEKYENNKIKFLDLVSEPEQVNNSMVMEFMLDSFESKEEVVIFAATLFHQLNNS